MQYKWENLGFLHQSPLPYSQRLMSCKKTDFQTLLPVKIKLGQKQINIDWQTSSIFSILRIIIKMNTNNTAFTRLQNNMGERAATPSTKDEKDLYECVLQKHYQIIQTFLQKINSLYIKNEEFEIAIASIQTRLEKLENSTSNIHYEFRTTHLTVDKRLNSIMADNVNINEQINMILRELPAESYLTTQHLLSKSAFLKNNRRNKNRANFDQNGSIAPKIVVNQTRGQNKEKKESKIESSLNLGGNQEQDSRKGFNRLSQTCKVIFPDRIASRMDSQSQSQSKQEQDISCKQDGKEAQSLKKSQKIGVVYDKQWVQAEISRQMDDFNIKMNAFTQQWNEEKAKLKAEIFGPDTQKYFNTINTKIEEKINEIKDFISIEQQKMSKDIQFVNETSLKNIGALEYKLAQKVENRFFEESMNNLSSAISYQLANNQKHFSNKQETQRAIRFLQNKINKIIQQDDNFNNSALMKSSKETKGDHQPCLRINRCASQKKTVFSASQKNINFKNVEAQTIPIVFNQPSLNASSVDLQKIQKCVSFKDTKENLAPTEPKKFNWKPISPDNLDIFKVQSEAKIRKASISKATTIKYRSSHSNFMPEERVNEKEWKQKVTKILNTGDRKRVKVTFH